MYVTYSSVASSTGASTASSTASSAISATGSAVLNKYNLQEEAQPTFPTYVTKEEFDTIISQLKTAIENKDSINDFLCKFMQSLLPMIESYNILKNAGK